MSLGANYAFFDWRGRSPRRKDRDCASATSRAAAGRVQSRGADVHEPVAIDAENLLHVTGAFASMRIDRSKQPLTGARGSIRKHLERVLELR